jgi:hypothetical protein
LRKIIKYTLRIILGLLLLLCVALFGGYIYLNTQSGRRWLKVRVTSLLSEQLGTRVQIGGIEYHLPKGLILRHVIIEDHHHFTMIGFEEAEVDYVRYNTHDKLLVLGNIELKNATFNLIHYKNEKESNFQLFLDRFASKDTTSSGASVVLNNINIEHLNFHWDGRNDSLSKIPGIDWSHIDMNDFGAKLSYLRLGSTTTAKIRSMHFKEKSGFTLIDMRTDMLYSNKKMEFANLYLKTSESELRDYIEFDYDDVLKFTEFVDSVHFIGRFNNSTVSFKDIAYFTDALTNKKDIVKLNLLQGEGRIADMHARQFDVEYGENSYAIGSGSMRGLPNIDETFIDVRVKSGRSSRKEIMRILPETSLPDEVGRFGTVTLKGSFTGFINDFVAYGNARTSLGEIVSDINLKLGKTSASSVYKGMLALNNFNLREFTGLNYLGYTTMSGNIEGRGFTLDDMKARLKASIDRLDVNGYDYKKLIVNGDVSKKFFNGLLSSSDKNFDLDFKGAVDYISIPHFTGNINLRNADLRALNLMADSLSIKSKMAFDFKGSNLDDIQGIIQATHTDFNLGGKNYTYDSLSIDSRIDSLKRYLRVYTNVFNAELKGEFKPTRLPALLKGLAGQYIDSSFLMLKGAAKEKQSLTFNIEFRQMDLLFKLMQQDISLQDTGYIRGSLSSVDAGIHIDGKIPGFRYNDYSAKNIIIKADSRNRELTLNITSDSLLKKDNLLFQDFRLSSLSQSDRFRFNINTSDSGASKSVNLKGKLDVSGTTGLLSIDSSKITIGDSAWDIKSKVITLQKIDSFIDVPLIEFSHGKQRLKVVGKYGKTGDYPIRIIVEDVSIKMLSTFVPSFAAFKGDINGQVLLNNINKKPILEAGLFVSPLVYQEDTLGILGTTTNFDQATQKLTIEGSLKNFETEDELVSVTGDINFAKNQAANLMLKLNESPLAIFSPLTGGYVSNLKGTAFANIAIKGTLAEPIILGKINFKNASMKVDYLQTVYHFADELKLAGKNINFNNFELKDINENPAFVNGKVILNKLSDISLDMNIRAKAFQMLNTKAQDNELYYGQAFGTGTIHVDGPVTNLHMSMALTTNKGTQFYLPIGQTSSYSGNDYITFVDHSKKRKKKLDYNFTGLTLDMELNVTPDAAMQIIFDPRVGDIIEGYGHGNLKLGITTDGDFNMYGVYYIDKGNYRFTALDIISKQFVINSGSSVTWRGSPYDAELNVQAIYNVRTSLSPFAEGSTDPNYNRIMKIQTQLDLKGSLFTPEIKMNFDIPDLNSVGNYSSDIDNSLRKIKNDDQELNKQVVSLLVFNRFVPVSSGFGSDANLTSVSDMISSQLSYLLFSHLVDGLSLGADFRGAGAYSYKASADIFNNRVNLIGNYDQNLSRNATYNAEVAYKIKDDGSMLAKASSRSSNNPVLQNNNVNTYGIGIFFRKEFDSLKDIFKKKQKKQPAPEPIIPDTTK